MKPVLIVDGDCQAMAIHHIISCLPALTENYDIFYNSAIPAVSNARITDEILSRCSVVWRQNGVAYNAGEESTELRHLPPNVQQLRFPGIALTALYPKRRADPLYPHWKDVEHRFGKFWYCDAAMWELIDTPLTGARLYQAYLEITETWSEFTARLLEHDAQFLLERDKTCDVTVATFVLSFFRTNRLFFTPNHMRLAYYFYLIEKLARQTLGEGRRIDRGYMAQYVAQSDIEGAQYYFPISKTTAKCLELIWWSEDELYYVKDTPNKPSRAMTFREYLNSYITERRLIRKRDGV